MRSDVRVEFYKEEDNICGFWCKQPSEMLKMLHYCKENEIPLWIRNDDEKINDKFKMTGEFFIEEVGYEFGSDACIQIIYVQLI